MGKGGPNAAPQTPTAPATVSGERLSEMPLDPGRQARVREGGKHAVTRKSGDRPCVEETMTPSGVTAKEFDMTTQTKVAAKPASALLSILFVALLGATSLFVAGHAQSATLHDAAHDVRHSSGFPCH